MMKRFPAYRLALAPLALAAAAPVVAQEDTLPVGESFDNVNLVIIYGDDDCPESTSGEIVVCPRLEENERFRIPQNLRESSAPENESWTSRAISMETVGNFGTLSCTPSGYGGWAGCTQQLIDAAYAEREGSSEVRAAQLIEEARAERLSTIDEEAAAEQARVEALEREYEARLEAERDAQLPGENELPQLTPLNETLTEDSE